MIFFFHYFWWQYTSNYMRVVWQTQIFLSYLLMCIQHYRYVYWMLHGVNVPEVLWIYELVNGALIIQQYPVPAYKLILLPDGTCGKPPFQPPYLQLCTLSPFNLHSLACCPFFFYLQHVTPSALLYSFLLTCKMPLHLFFDYGMYMAWLCLAYLSGHLCSGVNSLPLNFLSNC